jgi:hypothetical protein
VTLLPDEEDNQGFDMTILARHIYKYDFTIWEAMIRDALVEGRLEITDNQLSRVLTPVISDHNNNLIHHLSFNKKDRLVQIFEMPGLDRYYREIPYRHPFFFNLFGKS